jgi:cytoskeleton protein RodZ
MSSTLGEKLRQAREERGISISEVAEQTRISSLYLQSIENDDYKILPGGIFNKGFVKSYAKYVGIDEQEALQDYATLVASSDNEVVDEVRTYRPEVLTDDRTSSSTIQTAIFAGIILLLMSLGIWFIVSYIQNQQSDPAANVNTLPVLSNTNTNTNTVVAPPQTDKISVELKAVGEPVALTYVIDGKTTIQTLEAEQSLKLDAAESLKLTYSKYKSAVLKILLNGREITPPAATKGTIELEINKGNVAQLIQGSVVSATLPVGDPAVAANTNATPVPQTVATPRPRVEPVLTPKPPPPTANTAVNSAPPARATQTPIIVGNSAKKPN